MYILESDVFGWSQLQGQRVVCCVTSDEGANACSSLVRCLLSLFDIKRRSFLSLSVIKTLTNAKVGKDGIDQETNSLRL